MLVQSDVSMCEWYLFYFCCVFLQAEDGIRYKLVTGVQTCALPISLRGRLAHAPARQARLPAVRAPDRPGRGPGPRVRRQRRLAAALPRDRLPAGAALTRAR